MGEALTTGYSRAFGSFAYLGLASSGMWCQHPSKFETFYIEELKSLEDYRCSVESLPFEYPGWNEKWYNVACREWFQSQAERANANYVTDLYEFAGETYDLGLTACAPIVDYSNSVNGDISSRDFEAALCIDM